MEEENIITTATSGDSTIIDLVPINEVNSDDDDFDDGRLLLNQQYEQPKDADKFIDLSKEELIDKSKLSEFDIIKAVAKNSGITIRNPRSGCKHCYGRGYIGRDYKTKAPVPCSCIYPPQTQNQKTESALMEYNKNKPKMNKKTLKALKKLHKIEKKILQRQKIKEEQRLKTIEGN